ncbi:MAG: hypothetical protein QNJ14_15495 [Woeseiaceae bacterium]|nr:hypothetical protein [Woeseiaceae bacterium]
MDLSEKLQSHNSVLIVSCPVCPPASLATDTDSPFIELFKHGIKTPAYQDHLNDIRKPLERLGIRTGVFTSYVPTPTACMWTHGQRRRLRKRAQNYDAALVMGCESLRHLVEEELSGTDCEVMLGMQLIGITNATLRFSFPFTVRLDNFVRVSANEQAEHAP